MTAAQFAVMSDAANEADIDDRNQHAMQEISQEYVKVAQNHGGVAVARGFDDLGPVDDFWGIIDVAFNKNVTPANFADLYDRLDPDNRKDDLRAALNAIA